MHACIITLVVKTIFMVVVRLSIYIYTWSLTPRPYMHKLWEPVTKQVREAVEDRQKTTKKTDGQSDYQQRWKEASVGASTINFNMFFISEERMDNLDLWVRVTTWTFRTGNKEDMASSSAYPRQFGVHFANLHLSWRATWLGSSDAPSAEW